ncbi:MAG: 30S ribosomal protein S20 [Limnobacter sp.]|jgi:small subunit ribosomal protein S20|uniref:Small ribosomal subunit protein bS20 n=1 Tax=Limnobacter profundi TaxID=2732163 RepID=A0ABX6N6Y5_9BURK|nr:MULTISPECIES: 30S ribosomal protein S20 [Limnobacter]KJR43749.1 Ribosomal protein S20 [Candidatus Magnetoovum chiemensis]MAG80442.1 30S ribosomal protein S20 [Sutterellaceae bacterium]MBA4316143.1 30S ribosomal protein S20 [Alcaligenaceae bacterium]MBU0541768.1 30S ribosomal protein S20 [Gammaproteobacteria bacterium]PZO16665.1 MAG: 30S ribosomal protein S20 [Betaproteobacteria bacterium]|tara:strand:+ start:338 stop:604 length:267 start_codon:yes stop_codon:yes gene_type:complete
MANSAQARKRAKQAAKANAHNSAIRSAMRTAVKKVRAAVEAGDKAAAQAVYRETTSILDRVADKDLIHKNKASRNKSRLSALVKGMAA